MATRKRTPTNQANEAVVQLNRPTQQIIRRSTWPTTIGIQTTWLDFLPQTSCISNCSWPTLKPPVMLFACRDKHTHFTLPLTRTHTHVVAVTRHFGVDKCTWQLFVYVEYEINSHLCHWILNTAVTLSSHLSTRPHYNRKLHAAFALLPQQPPYTYISIYVRMCMCVCALRM